MPTWDPRANDLFLKALELRSSGERQQYLDEACAADKALRAEVEALLEASARAGNFLEFPAAGLPLPLGGAGPVLRGATMDEQIRERLGTVIGPYKLLQKIGEGGFGTVFMAEQTQPVKRKVALKVIKPGMDSRQVIARFEAERQALALMDHVNIARVFDGGATESGRPYFVMELVHGVPITKYCDDNQLTPRERLELFVPVCQAIQHAHQKGIIHRDIKPSNVMITLYDGKPVPKVIDFGVAKATEQKLTERTLFTQYGTMVGTLEYMSPEQAEMSALGVDTRSDIYSLGVLLYELLTGSTPLTHKRMKEAAYAEILRIIKEEEPPKPSTRLSDSGEALASISANRQTEPAKLTKLVRGELDWIVMKALEKDRSRRYETANGFAMDVQRYLADEAVQACPPSVGYRLRKFARRNKGGLAVAALVLFFLVLLGSGVGWAVRDRSAREAEAAQQQAARQGKVAGQVESIFAELDRFMKAQKWDEALAVARRAEAAVAGGEADAEIAERVHQRLRELEFIDRLERIRMKRAVIVNGQWDNAGADREYGTAFRDYGVDVETLAVEASIDRLKAQPGLAIPLAAALDDWVFVRRSVPESEAAAWKHLVAIARAVDRDGLRDQVRAAWLRPDFEVLDDLRRSAESIDVRMLHPATVVSLARTLHKVNQPDAAARLLRVAQHAHPGDFWLNWELGYELFRQSDDQGATRFFTAAVSIRPNSVAAHNSLGTSLPRQSRLDEAITCFRKAIELDPYYAPAHYNLGNALAKQRKLDEAVAAYKKSVELEPKRAFLYYPLGNTLRDQGRLKEAIDAYKMAIQVDPNYEAGHNGLGALLCDELKDYDKAIECFRDVIKLNPKNVLAHKNLGNALLGQKRLDEAIECYRKAGDILNGQKKWDAAIAAYRRALDIKTADAAAVHDRLNSAELDRRNAHLHYGLAFALDRETKVDEAITHYRRAVELNPKHARAHYGLGSTLHLRGKVDEAITHFRKAVELDPNYAIAYDGLGNSLRDQGKLEEAIAAHKQAIRLQQTNPGNYGNFGVTLYAQKNLDEAIRAFRKAIELKPNYLDAPNWLARCLNERAWDLATHPEAARRNPGRAVSLAKEAVELKPQEGNYHNTLGVALYRTGDWKAAVAALEKSMGLRKGGDSFDWFFLAIAHWQLGEKDKAREWYGQAVQWMDKNQSSYEELRPFRAEAAVVLELKEKK
ncbi:MAG: tetratricopeptide repeat protein [Planctomycetes bacterium]|nr:tetratricopeptide repeat protein [Planctomycetota bacterium]